MRSLDIEKMQEKIRQIIQARDWGKFHSPKNQSISLLLEASELMEIFQWLTEKESYEIKNNPKKMIEVKEELADILFWVLLLSDHFQIDLQDAFWKKMKKNEKNYPVKLSKGNATKHTELKKLKKKTAGSHKSGRH